MAADVKVQRKARCVDKIKIVLCGGVRGRRRVAATTTSPTRRSVLRVLMVLGGLLAAGAVAWLSAPGKQFFAFAPGGVAGSRPRLVADAQGNDADDGRSCSPSSSIMALFLFAVDTTLAWIVKLLTGRGEG